MPTDHIKMLYDIGEFNNLFSESITLESFLHEIVATVAEHMAAEVCSIYLYDDTTDYLTLKATIGLNPDSVNNVRLRLGEGLVGLAMRDLSPICEKCGIENPNFKFYPGINEENFESFLATPIARGNIRIGVLVVQRQKGRPFAEQDIIALRATASQLASMIENIKYILTPLAAPQAVYKKTDLEKLKFIKGKSASKGYAYNEAVIIEKDNSPETFHGYTGRKIYTLDDFNRALKATETQLNDLQKKVEEKLSDAASLIFSVHLLMLKDSSFTGSMRELISKGKNAPEAIIEVYEKYRDIFSQSQSDIIKEKVQDIGDLAKRIMDNLAGNEGPESRYKDRIVIARDIFPSDLLMMSAEGIGGIILVSGGVTSHISILARSLGIPVVIANVPELLELPENTMALIDGEIGNIYINPSVDIVNKFSETNTARNILIENDSTLKTPAFTCDSTSISVMVNINLLSDLLNLKGIYNDGIGLYRTEFPFIIRNTFPGEEEQYIIYSKLIAGMDNKPVTFRTLDIGGDKVLSYYQGIKEENPFLGMRSIRFSLTHRDIFKQQLRAILRAGYNSNIKIMFPMISSLDEFISSKEIVLECIDELRRQKIDHNKNPEIGMMIEIPSVVNILDDFVGEADFFSIGTNDLIQYTLAVDRTNENVADLYMPHHPAILRSLKTVSDTGIQNDIPVSICGDMAGDDRYIPFLLGIGIRRLSVDSGYLASVKKLVSKISVDYAKEIADEMLAKSRVSDISRIVESLSLKE